MPGEGRNLRHLGFEPARARLRAMTTMGAALLFLLVAGSAAPALAAPAWLAPLDLSPVGQDAEEPQVAVDPAGDAVAVWARSDGSHTIIEAAERPAGGAWGPVHDLSTPGRDATEPQVAVDAAGGAIAVWTRTDGAHTIVQGASMTAGGGWQQAVNLSLEGQNAKTPQVAVDPTGNAVAVWSRYNSTKFIVQSSSRPAGGDWGEPVDVSAVGQNAEAPQIAVDPAGNAVAVWSRFNGAKFIVQSSSRPAGGGWGEPIDASTTGQSAETPQVALDAHGNAVAVWARFDGSDYIIQSADLPTGGVWSSPYDLSKEGQSAKTPQLAVDPAGDAVAVWARANGGPTTIIQGTGRPAGGAWQEAVPLTSLGLVAAEAPQVSIDPAGNAIAVWTLSDSSPNVAQSATKPAAMPWQPHTNLSVIGHNATEPQVGLDPAGNGVAVWSRDNGANAIVQAIGYDGVGPQLRTVSIPSAGTIHQPMRFAVSPFDVWSSIGPIAWTFGDGEADVGPAVTHTYGQTGVYQVSVTAADTLLNASAAKGTVTIYPKASASRNVRVRGGRALLRLRCPSPAGCEGLLKLIAGVRVEHRRHLVGRRVQIGKASFAIPGAATTIVPVPLTSKGKAVVRGAPRSGVKAQLTGPGVKHRLVALFGPRR